jgi:hypothetical protein
VLVIRLVWGLVPALEADCRFRRGTGGSGLPSPRVRRRWYRHRLIRLARSVRPPLAQCTMWCRSVRRDSQPGNRHRPLSRSRAARRCATFGRGRRRPRAKMAPPRSCRIHDRTAVQQIICAVDTLSAGPSSTWHRAGWAGSPGTGSAAAGVSAETPACPPAARVSAPTCTITWYTAASSAPATFPARNDSATATRASARPEDVRTTGSAGVSAGTSRCPSSGVPSRSLHAARSALSSTVPCNGGSRNVPDSDPSSSIRQASRRRTRASPSSTWVTCRWARANRSSWFPVIGPAISASPASLSGVAIRVSARTLAYDSRPAPNSPRITGSSRSTRATRTCSRAVPADIWHFQDSHCAQLFISHDAQPLRASKSPSRTRNRQVAAARCPASSQICASSRSSGTVPPAEAAERSAAGSEDLVSNINLRLAAGSDIEGHVATRPALD